jgi:hypothetical protein
MTPNSFKNRKTTKSWEDVRKKTKTDKISLDFQTYCQCHHGRA